MSTANNMKIVEINEGQKITYAQDGARIYFGDDELMINASKYQRDWPIQLDICCNRDGQLVVGTGEGLYYVAQVAIPAVQYAEMQVQTPAGSGAESNASSGAEPMAGNEHAADGEPDADPEFAGEDMGDEAATEALPLEMTDVTLTLWSIDKLTPANVAVAAE